MGSRAGRVPGCHVKDRASLGELKKRGERGRRAAGWLATSCPQKREMRAEEEERKRVSSTLRFARPRSERSVKKAFVQRQPDSRPKPSSPV